LNKDLIKENCEKYFAANNKANGNNTGGDDNSNRKKGRDNNNKKNDVNPVDSRRKKWSVSGIQLVNSVLKVNCKECGLNITHSGGFHVAWMSNKSNFCLPTSQPFVAEKDQMVNYGHVPWQPAATPVPSSSSNTRTFS
jgi:hypothetical protein